MVTYARVPFGQLQYQISSSVRSSMICFSVVLDAVKVQKLNITPLLLRQDGTGTRRVNPLTV